MKIIIAHYFKPSSAATNRIIAYAKAFSQLDGEVVLVLGGNEVTQAPELEGVRVIGVTAPLHQLLPIRMAIVIKKEYVKGNSAILLYGSPVLCLFLPKRIYCTLFECTEIPFYGLKKTMRMRIKETIKLTLAKRATAMLVITNSLQDYFQSMGVRNIKVINMFVDTERFMNIDYKTNEKYIAYCGKISNFKDGLDCLVKAFGIFHDHYPQYNLKLIGDFRYPAFEKQLRQLIHSLLLDDYVHFTGVVGPDRMPELLCGAEMLVLARPNNEQAKYGFPTKLGEYLATGKPVVVTNVGEIGQFLKDGVNCRMAKPDNPEDFAEKMLWVANHYDEALALGEQGRKLTTTEFSALEQSRKTYCFINDLIE